MLNVLSFQTDSDELIIYYLLHLDSQSFIHVYPKFQQDMKNVYSEVAFCDDANLLRKQSTRIFKSFCDLCYSISFPLGLRKVSKKTKWHTSEQVYKYRGRPLSFCFTNLEYADQ